MSWSCSIRAINDDDNGRSGVKVTLMGSLLGGYLSEYTDSDGWVEFEIDGSDQYEVIWENIYIDGEEVSGSITINDGETLSFNT
jgi:hypothetical protein